MDFTTHVFATAYAAVDRDLPKLFATKPDVVLMFGLAARRRHLCVETRARNAVSLLFPDASGYRPQNGAILRGAPSTRRGNAPFAQVLGGACAGAMPARLSRDAGRYLCNYAYWRALAKIRGNRPLVQFIHIPQLRLQPRPLRTKRQPSLAQCLPGAEAVLIALIAASRR
jgi:pyroglutamyl-peptidase